MIFGIGTDIAETKRFEKWVSNPSMYERFFNAAEQMEGGSVNRRCQHYAVRFAAKEAFSKALGTGISGFDLKDVYILKDKNGKPYLEFSDKVKKLLDEKCGKWKVHVSLTHEKEYALAFVVIETF